MQNSNKKTLVTAIYHTSHEERIGGRNYTFEFYEAPFLNVLNLGCNIVVFSHQPEINKIISFFKLHNFVDYKIIDYDLNSYIYSDRIYELKEQKNIIDKNGLIEGNCFILNDRNTHLCLLKIEFLKNAISNNYFNTNEYYWIDAGLFHNGIFPTSFGGKERLTRPKLEEYWPNDVKNICTPDLIDKLNKKNNNQSLLFIGLTNFSLPSWWHNINDEPKQIHIIGGLFGGDKNEILKLHPQFEELTKQILDSDELTLEEDIFSILIVRNNFNYIKFDMWYHDIVTDSCYYGISPDVNCFYKVFI